MATAHRTQDTSAAVETKRQTAFPGDNLGLVLTRHAEERMSQRRIPVEAVCAALDYGHVYRTRGAVIYALTRRAADQCRNDGSAITKLDGLQVVCGDSGSIVTVYRNRDFRSLKPQGRVRRPVQRRGGPARTQ